MEEDKNVFDFNAKLLVPKNECVLLGEGISEGKMVRKILRSLPERFNYNVAAIKEARDLDTHSELISTLQTFEMGLRENKAGKKNNLAFKVSKVDDEDLHINELVQNIAFLTRKFQKFTKGKKYVGSSSNPQKEKNKTERKDNFEKGLGCYECEGYEHIRSECANLFKYQNTSKKAFHASHNDDETNESDHDEYEEETYIAKVAIQDGTQGEKSDTLDNFNSDPFYIKESDKEDDDHHAYILELQLIKERCEQVTDINQSLSKQLFQGTLGKDKLHDQLRKTQNDLEIKQKKLIHVHKLIKSLNSGTEKLDEILKQGRRDADKSGLSYSMRGSSKRTCIKGKSKMTKFTLGKGSNDEQKLLPGQIAKPTHIHR